MHSRWTRLIFVLMVCLSSSWSQAEEFASETLSLDFSKAWFKPELVENKDEACIDLLKDAQEKFFSPVDFNAAYGLQGYGYAESGKILDWELVTGQGQGEIEAYGKTFYLNVRTNPGCGGGCETNQPLVSNQPFPNEGNDNDQYDLAMDEPPAASYNYTIAKNSKGEFYLFIVGNNGEHNDRLLVYKLAPEAKWTSACKISLTAENLDKIRIKDFSSAYASIRKLNAAVGGLTRGAGNCGTSGTAGRWAIARNNALVKTLARPWGINVGMGEYGGNSYGYYDISMENLEKWQLTGIAEYNDFLAYKRQFDETALVMSNFYENHFGWTKETSSKMAISALKAAISRGIGFYMYAPFGSEAERTWRKAILEKAPVEELKKLSVDDFTADSKTQYRNDETGESILNVAVTYPQALTLLLDKGMTPNVANAFGKTPLMYAAQYNALEAARILLDHGADPNAATIAPADTCYYTLHTFNMTPLHYAVRYASSELITLLLDHGAEPFIKARNKSLFDSKQESPLEWLHFYTAANANERNLNIPVAKVAEIERRLKLPEAGELAGVAKRSILAAEKFAQEGKLETAYRLLQKVLNLQPDNERALSDMSLVALKQGEIGPSLEAGGKLIRNSKDVRLIANAWFNQGLACEQRGFYSYNGNYYCRNDLVFYYLQSLLAEPAPSRQKKLVEIFRQSAVNNCRIPYGDKLISLAFGDWPNPEKPANLLHVIYVLHDSSQEIHPNDFSWDQKFWHTGNSYTTEHIVPQLMATHSLGGESLTLLGNNKVAARFPFMVGNQTCGAR